MPLTTRRSRRSHQAHAQARREHRRLRLRNEEQLQEQVLQKQCRGAMQRRKVNGLEHAQAQTVRGHPVAVRTREVHELAQAHGIVDQRLIDVALLVLHHMRAAHARLAQVAEIIP